MDYFLEKQLINFFLKTNNELISNNIEIKNQF